MFHGELFHKVLFHGLYKAHWIYLKKKISYSPIFNVDTGHNGF